MSSLIKDLSNHQLAQAFDTWLSVETTDWRVGLGLLVEFSRRRGAAFSKDNYLKGLRRLFEIKPTLRGREEQFFPADFAVPLNEIKALFQAVGQDFCLAALEGVNIEPHVGTDRYDVPLIDSLDRFDQQIDLLLRDVAPRFRAAAAGRLLTFGSCFAMNVGRYLRDRGRSVYTMVVAEDVNSPFNNLQLLKRVFLGERTPISEELGLLGNLDYDQLKQEFLGATGIVFTLGNIFHLEVDGCSTVSLSKGATLVAETFDQTAGHLREILGLLKTHTTASIMTSVSPIPISGYRGSTFKTAIEADCLSKSQLRAALHACQAEFPEMVYVPTFEIFRWLPAHQTFATFGTDDGIGRHISAALIKRVMDKLA